MGLFYEHRFAVLIIPSLIVGEKIEAPKCPRDPAPLGQRDERDQGDGLVSTLVFH